MAYRSKYTGARVDELLTLVENMETNPGSVLENISGDDIIQKLSGEQILSKLTGQQIIDKINSVSGNIVFVKYVDCQAGAGKTTE